MNVISIVLVAISALLIFTAAIGVLRFPDATSRLHAVGKVGGLAAIALLLAHLVESPSLYTFFKVALIALLMIFTSAQAAQVLAHSSLPEGEKFSQPKE